MFHSNIGPNWAHLRDIRLRNVSDLDFDLSRSLKVKCDSATGLPMYAFVFMSNSNTGPNMAPLRDIRLQNLSDLEFYLSRSLYVKFNGAVGLPIYDFLLVSNINPMCKSHRLGVIVTGIFFSYLLLLGPNFDTPPPTPTLTPGRFFFSKSNHFILGSKGSLPLKMKLIGETLFALCC